jgi:tRNA A37 threonylcarbamoyladenosine dehydratase
MLIGEDGVQKLKAAHVAVFGLGGVGSYTAEALARSGVGELTLVDNDTVAESNLNRQLYALHSTLGPKPKRSTARFGYNPECRVHTVCEPICGNAAIF